MDTSNAYVGRNSRYATIRKPNGLSKGSTAVNSSAVMLSAAITAPTIA
jgi:hypothetical protein